MKKVIVKNTLLILAATLLFASCTADVKSKEKEYVKTTEIPIIVRDFVPYTEKDASLQEYKHYDFDHINSAGICKNYVLDTLDKDKKPVLSNTCNLNKIGIKSPESFAQWFRTIKGVNKEIKTSLEFLLGSTDPIKYEFYDPTFFPIDDQGFGNGSDSHNFDFTIESTFYLLCEENLPITITCRADDDLWVFVNGKILIDLGGCHVEESLSITFNAEDYNAKPGEYLEVKLFKAERYVCDSRLLIRVSQDLYTLK